MDVSEQKVQVYRFASVKNIQISFFGIYTDMILDIRMLNSNVFFRYYFGYMDIIFGCFQNTRCTLFAPVKDIQILFGTGIPKSECKVINIYF